MNLLVAALILGTWQYDGFFFDGHRYPNPNPNLNLQFTFTETVSHLIWWRTGEAGFCEREADYSVEKDLLRQKVTWVNPANLFECSRDPDMHLGQETANPFVIENDELKFTFELNGKPFIYILRRCGSTGTMCLNRSQDRPFKSK